LGLRTFSIRNSHRIPAGRKRGEAGDRIKDRQSPSVISYFSSEKTGGLETRRPIFIRNVVSGTRRAVTACYLLSVLRRIDMITNKVKIALISGAAAILAAIISAVVTVRTSPGTVGNSNAKSNAENNMTVNVNPQGVPVTLNADLEDVSIVVLDSDTGALITGAVITVTGSGGNPILQNHSIPTGQY
jgi:hypothetical protein